jgi:death on curing protein
MTKSEPRWVSRLAIDVIHGELISAFGGRTGHRDEGALDSALGRPRNKWSYEQDHDLASLAVAYAFGIARNHPFVDGNKRTAFLALVVFLGLNGRDLDAPESEVVTAMYDLAAGKLSEKKLATWVRKHVRTARSRR